jgi:hypothetical protein
MNAAPSGLYAIYFIGSQGAARGLLHATPLGSSWPSVEDGVYLTLWYYTHLGLKF